MFEMKKNACVHFIGIGGIGMSGMAEILLSIGHNVSGSDISSSSRTRNLKSRGAKIFIGHHEDNVISSTIVVYSSAIGADNPEIISAFKRKIPLIKRAEMLAELMRLKKGLAIAGTHGKTTTTSFLATILQESGLSPTYIIGGVVNNLNGHAKIGEGDLLVVEADESDGSFLLLNPIMSIITNIDNDHMDYYKSSTKLQSAFTSFANNIPFYGRCALNANDEASMELKSMMKKPWTTFGMEMKGIDFMAKNLHHFPDKTEFDLYYKDKFAVPVTIRLPGDHNVLNALGAISLASCMRMDFKQISSAIGKFEGVGRRLEVLFDNDRLEIIDDYAHHPTEISKTLQILRETRRDSKIVVIFEPHRFTRTKYCWDMFLHCFNQADLLFLCPIYPAGENPIPGIDSKRMADDINNLHPGLARDLENLNTLPVIETRQKVSLITLGAGSIGRKIRKLTKSL